MIFSGYATINSSRREFLRMAVIAGGMAAMPLFASGCAPLSGFLRKDPLAFEDWSLERKVAQMLIPGFPGAVLSDKSPIVSHISEYGVGGVVLFDNDPLLQVTERNITSPEQLSRLAKHLQELASTPLFIAVDQEGGRVARLKEQAGFPPSTSAKTLGASGNPDETEKASEKIASTLAANGINLNLAPVVDVDLNPLNQVIGAKERSFSSNPEIVARHAAAFIKGHHRRHIATCIKHFPGHGSSSTDSHLGLVDVTDTWSEAELIPYREIISSGLCDMVMTAHTFNRKIDPDYPATLSKATIDGILRKKLKYDGLVLSDDLYMGAIARHYSYENAVALAINAGVDMLIMANDKFYEPDMVPRAIDFLSRKVRNGEISQSRIDEACRRIVAAKRRYLA